jgi:hypothetical protein
MDEPSILVLRPGQLKAADRKALREIGVVVLEVDDPEDVRFMRPAAELTSSEMLACALRAIKSQGASSYLGTEIISAVLAKKPVESHSD